MQCGWFKRSDSDPKFHFYSDTARFENIYENNTFYFNICLNILGYVTELCMPMETFGLRGDLFLLYIHPLR